MRFLVIILAILFLGPAYSQELPNLNCDAPRMPYFIAGSSLEDDGAIGGYSSSNNRPIEGADQLNIRKIGVQLFVDRSSQIEYQEPVLNSNITETVNGHFLYLVNNSDSTVGINAQDSRIKILAEAYIDGEWQEIEYFQNSWCGNSYHKVLFRSNEYWKFKVPVYEGSIQTKIRYKLWMPSLKTTSSELGGYIYSNFISASINRSQIVQPDSQTNTLTE
ncbi:MAG: hypothetical protein QNK23_06260 [Crocinitomicaceae bacterium]|nr:hypothetical protein [Crocinitomicaceae bacterium]